MTPTYNAQANPHLGAPGITTMHGDAQSSDATPLAGPGAGDWKITGTKLGGACPTILAGRDGFIQVLCTQVFAHGEFITPKLSILDPHTGRELSHLTSRRAHCSVACMPTLTRRTAWFWWMALSACCASPTLLTVATSELMSVLT